MKRNILSLFAVPMCAVSLMMGGCYSVRPVAEGSIPASGGVFYALPMTRICIDVTYSYYDLTDAVFSQYAAEMLALDNFDVDKPYRIRDIQTSYTVTADPDHYYLVNPSRISVQVDGRNLLRAVGMIPQEVSALVPPSQTEVPDNGTQSKMTLHNATADQLLPTYNLYDRTDTFYVRGDRPGNPTGTSTKKAPRSLRQRAQDAAEEIAELEDSRADIALSDRYTLEGKRQTLEQLEEREARLLTQFIGKPVTETAHFYIQPKPISSPDDTVQQIVAFYFSRSEGICDSDDYGAMPVICTLRPDQAMRQVRNYTASYNSKSLLPRNNFQYRLPSQASLTLQCQLFDYSTTIPVAQFGTIVNLPHKRFKALFDPSSGAIVYYSDGDSKPSISLSTTLFSR